MSWLQHQSKEKDGFPRYPPPSLLVPSSQPYDHGSLLGQSPQLPPPPLRPSSSGVKISPVLMFPVVILASVLFFSGLLHLLVRFLSKNPFFTRNSESNGYPEVSAPEGQLRQLFHSHDSGLDQAFIDALPVFLFKEIMGTKEPFDCAVCLCEFSEKDKLRLLPLCGHAFHVSCIDTWLMSNSTCPLCRGTLFTPGFPTDNPMFEFDELRDEDGCSPIGEIRFPSGKKIAEAEQHAEEKGLFPVRLGKFRNSNDGLEEASEGETSSSNLDARRCYSLGSYQYEVRPNNLRVALCPDRTRLNLRLVKGNEHVANTSLIGDLEEERKIGAMSKGDSYSISKIWLWPKTRKFSSSSNAPAGVPSLPWMDRTANV
ncbi:hypothetical protein Dimus_011276 [Dionaea muscipula]